MASLFENELDLVDKMCRTNLPLKETPGHCWLSRSRTSQCFCMCLSLIITSTGDRSCHPYWCWLASCFVREHVDLNEAPCSERYE